MKLSDLIVQPDCSIIEAMKQINYNGKGIVYVCRGDKLEGVLTDGDIRRHILEKGDLEMAVIEIANKNPHYLLYEERKKVRDRLEKYKIPSLPIIDKNGRILEVHFLRDEISGEKEQLDIPVVIMAGGKGTRLYPYTEILPKPLIPIGEKTITEHIMERFKAYGCAHFDMIVNYKKNFIKSYFMDNDAFADIAFIEEKEYLGTGGGLKLLDGRYSSTFFMSNCDILVEENYGEILRHHRERKNIVTMVCAMKQLTIPYGTVEVSETGDVLKLREKPELSFMTNTGLYVLEPEFLEEIPDNTFIHITDIIQKCINDGKNVGVYPISEKHWLDMGQLDELEKMREYLTNI